MAPGRGFRVFQSAPHAEDIPQSIGALTLTRIADSVYGCGVMNSAIGLVAGPPDGIRGPALTVEATPGNGLMIRAAIQQARPGHVIVVSSPSDGQRALFGGRFLQEMADQGIVGVVVDGVVRDKAEMEAVGIPVYARGLTLRSGTNMSGRGEVNAPVACGGVAVLPGDLVIADPEGIISIPSGDVAEVLEAALNSQTLESNARRKTSKYHDVMTGLLDAGCIEIDSPWVATVPSSM